MSNQGSYGQPAQGAQPAAASHGQPQRKCPPRGFPPAMVPASWIPLFATVVPGMCVRGEAAGEPRLGLGLSARCHRRREVSVGRGPRPVGRGCISGSARLFRTDLVLRRAPAKTPSSSQPRNAGNPFNAVQHWRALDRRILPCPAPSPVPSPRTLPSGAAIDTRTAAPIVS